VIALRKLLLVPFYGLFLVMQDDTETRGNEPVAVKEILCFTVVLLEQAGCLFGVFYLILWPLTTF